MMTAAKLGMQIEREFLSAELISTKYKMHEISCTKAWDMVTNSGSL